MALPCFAHRANDQQFIFDSIEQIAVRENLPENIPYLLGGQLHLADHGRFAFDVVGQNVLKAEFLGEQRNNLWKCGVAEIEDARLFRGVGEVKRQFFPGNFLTIRLLRILNSRRNAFDLKIRGSGCGPDQFFSRSPGRQRFSSSLVKKRPGALLGVFCVLILVPGR